MLLGSLSPSPAQFKHLTPACVLKRAHNTLRLYPPMKSTKELQKFLAKPKNLALVLEYFKLYTNFDWTQPNGFDILTERSLPETVNCQDIYLGDIYAMQNTSVGRGTMRGWTEKLQNQAIKHIPLAEPIAQLNECTWIFADGSIFEGNGYNEVYTWEHFLDTMEDYERVMPDYHTLIVLEKNLEKKANFNRVLKVLAS